LFIHLPDVTLRRKDLAAERPTLELLTLCFGYECGEGDVAAKDQVDRFLQRYRIIVSDVGEDFTHGATARADIASSSATRS
jgi:hypothetical protein